LIARAARSFGPRLALGLLRYVDQEVYLIGRVEMKVFRVALAGALFWVAVTAAFGMSVKSDFQTNFDFSQLRTFAFKTDRSSNDPLIKNTIEARRIQNALAAQLEANGFTQSAQNPDFIVAFYASRQTSQVESTGFGPGYVGYGPGFGWGYGIPYRGFWQRGFSPDIWTTKYTQGSVMVDIIDARKDELVWRGVIKDTVHGIGQSVKQADQAAKDMVKKYLSDTKKVDKQVVKKSA